MRVLGTEQQGLSRAELLLQPSLSFVFEAGSLTGQALI